MPKIIRTSILAAAFVATGLSLAACGNNNKNNQPQSAYNSAKQGTENAYNNAKQGTENAYNGAKNGTENAYNSAKNNMQGNNQ